MIKVENIVVHNVARAIYSARNALNSWDKSDSDLKRDIVGPKDLDLAQRLYKGGPEHRKFMRQIFLTMDITGPLYWISELDTYKVGTTRNSCSFMHKGLAKGFTMDDFSWHSSISNSQTWDAILEELNRLRYIYLSTKDPNLFQEIRDLLPSGYNLKFTLTMSYENAANMIHQRKDHRLKEWREFTEILLDNLPYLREIMGE